MIIARPPIVQTTNAWADLFKTLYNNGQIVFGALAQVVYVLVQLGGATICAGGILSFKNHLRSGKELIGLGTGVGLADLLLLAHSGTFGPQEWLGWGGLVLGVLAGRHIHGPEASYAGEIRRLLASLRARVYGKNQKQVRRRRTQRQRARRGRELAGQYDVGRDKKSQSKGPSE